MNTTASPSSSGVDHSPNSALMATRRDRKSTRLNSSHLVISYAVFCLKKKKFPLDAGRILAVRLLAPVPGRDRDQPPPSPEDRGAQDPVCDLVMWQVHDVFSQVTGIGL